MEISHLISKAYCISIDVDCISCSYQYSREEVQQYMLSFLVAAPHSMHILRIYNLIVKLQRTPLATTTSHSLQSTGMFRRETLFDFFQIESFFDSYKFVLHCLIYSFFISSGKGYIRCVETALVESGVTKQDVNYINAHAASTPTFDFVEYQSMLHLFGQNTEVVVL